MSCVPRIWKGAGRRGRYADASKRSRTIHIDDIEALVYIPAVLLKIAGEKVFLRCGP